MACNLHLKGKAKKTRRRCQGALLLYSTAGYPTMNRFLLIPFTIAAAWAQQSFVPQVIATPGAPSTILYGLYHGNLVRSADLGSTWAPLYLTTPGLPQPPVQGFDFNPLSPSTLYLATSVAAGTFWKSTDGGATWAKSNTGLPTAGGTVDYFKQVLDQQVVYLYVKIGNGLYKSSDGAATWLYQGTLPGSAGRMEIAEGQRAYMYYIEPSTMVVWSSGSEGYTWTQAGNIPAVLQNASIVGLGVLYFNSGWVFVSVDGIGSGQGTYYTRMGGGTFTDTTSIGLGTFTKILSGTFGPSYALTPGFIGTYRSDPADSGQAWKARGITGDHYGVTAADPNFRSTVYGVQTLTGSATPVALATSTNGGDLWTAIPATITPTIAKPAAGYSITLEEGAPYSTSLNVQLLEDSSWKTPVTLSTSGEPWLQIGQTSGMTPLPDTLTIASGGLAPGTYTSTIRIDAPQTANKFVTIPVQLTIRPLGSLGPGYTVSTVAGSGNASDSRTSGKATDLGIGGAKALAFDSAGNLLISAGSLLWQLSSGNLAVLAGNGVNASSGDGLDPLSASIADPDSLVLDSAANLYLTEYGPKRVRKLTAGSISTALDIAAAAARARLSLPVGSHNLLFDSANRMLLTGPPGLLRYDGLNLTVATPYAFSDPYGMVADAAGNLYISDRALHQIFKIAPAGGVSLVAGSGLAGFAGDGGPALQALLNTPLGLAVDSQGTLYIADSGNHRIRTITPDGTIHTIAGSGVPGFAGDGATGDFASFRNPSAVAVDARGNIFVADAGNNRVRMLAPQSTATPLPTALAGHGRNTKLAPGAVFSLYGSQLSGSTASVSTAPWPRSLAGASVTINGIPAPLYSVSPGQINGQVPFETAVGTATASIAVNGSAPAQITFQVVPAEPDVFEQAAKQALAVNQDGSVNSPSNPAHADDFEVLYLTGIGIPTTPVATGAASPSSAPFALVNYPYSITVNGEQTKVFFLGYAPGFPALVQANFQIPGDLAPGDYQLVVTVNGESSAPTIVSVR